MPTPSAGSGAAVENSSTGCWSSTSATSRLSSTSIGSTTTTSVRTAAATYDRPPPAATVCRCSVVRSSGGPASAACSATIANCRWPRDVIFEPDTIGTRNPIDLDGLVHHSDRGVQYLSIRYSERLAEEGAICSVGSRGDSYDNALAESFNGLYKTEVIRKRGPWRSFEQLELATARWVEWYNQRRLHSSIGMVPPAEFEEQYYRSRAEASDVA